ncbi:MAG: purine-nucleoside phosphorylase [Muribaculaceae bacterium]|nr:purine-nucleoside phosphorylase [Muribaculaceae bacterium]
MSTPHNNAPDGAYAKTVLMPGDPLRAKFIAENFLEDDKLINDVRNVYAFTGTYKGKPVTVMASGMGMPSIGIYSHEIYTQYGVENIIRIGSAGSYTEDLNVQDVVIAKKVVSESSFALVHNGVTDKELYPDETINAKILEAADRLGINCKEAIVHSSDVFYAGPNGQDWHEVRRNSGADCVEMESFALFAVANMLGKHAACLLTISDSLVNHVELSALDRQESFRTMMTLALEAAISL